VNDLDKTRPAVKPTQTVTVATKHSGNWDPEPGAWKLSNHLTNRCECLAVTTRRSTLSLTESLAGVKDRAPPPARNGLLVLGPAEIN
jgi:hypothetical protein